MNLILYYLFVYLIEAIILWLYCNRIFTSRKNTFLSLLITIGMFSLLIPEQFSLMRHSMHFAHSLSICLHRA